MFIKAQSKQRFGDITTPYLNVDNIVSAHVGHDQNVVVKMSNDEEYVIPPDRAKKLMEYLTEQELR